MRRRAAKVIAIALIGLAVLATVVNQFTPHSGGTGSSSYATASDGLAGYAALLMKSGHPVSRLRTPPWHADLDPHSTVVMLDPNVVLAKDVAALRSFVEAGGRLITGGRAPEAWLSELLGGAPDWTAKSPANATPLVPVPETAGVQLVDSDGTGAFTRARRDAARAWRRPPGARHRRQPRRRPGRTARRFLAAPEPPARECRRRGVRSRDRRCAQPPGQLRRGRPRLRRSPRARGPADALEVGARRAPARRPRRGRRAVPPPRAAGTNAGPAPAAAARPRRRPRLGPRPDGTPRARLPGPSRRRHGRSS